MKRVTPWRKCGVYRPRRWESDDFDVWLICKEQDGRVIVGGQMPQKLAPLLAADLASLARPKAKKRRARK